jgi:excisionase family DNA binding protein
MSTSMPNAGSPAFYSVKQAAWILGVSEHQVLRAIRSGALGAVRRRSRLVVPAGAWHRLLGGAP